MLLSEFAKLTGFNPTPECYHDFIEPQYNGSTLQKDEWCKKWKKDHGIARAYDWQVNYYRNLQDRYNQQVNDIQSLRNKNKELESKNTMMDIELDRLKAEREVTTPIIRKFNTIKNILGQ